MAPRVISEIFNVEIVVTLKAGSKVIESGTYHLTDSVWFPSVVTLSLKRIIVFEIFDFNTVTLKPAG